MNADEIWTSHLNGLTDQGLAKKYNIPIRVIRSVIADQRSKFPRQVEERAMCAYVRRRILRGGVAYAIKREVWDIYRMIITEADIRTLASHGSGDLPKSILRALGGRRSARKAKSVKHTTNLSARATTALCASTANSLKTVEKEVKRLVRQTLPATRKAAAVQETVQFLTVDAMQEVVDTLLDEF